MNINDLICKFIEIENNYLIELVTFSRRYFWIRWLLEVRGTGF